jgi:hypothetical protein
MGQIAVGESSAMITNVQLDNVTVSATDEFHVPGTVGERIVHQVSQRILQPLAVRGDRGLVGVDGDHAALQLSTTTSALSHLLEKIAELDRFSLQAEPMFVRSG